MSRVKSRNCVEAYRQYAVQVIMPIDTEIAKKGHFRVGTDRAHLQTIKQRLLKASIMPKNEKENML